MIWASVPLIGIVRLLVGVVVARRLGLGWARGFLAGPAVIGLAVPGLAVARLAVPRLDVARASVVRLAAPWLCGSLLGVLGTRLSVIGLAVPGLPIAWLAVAGLSMPGLFVSGLRNSRLVELIGCAGLVVGAGRGAIR